MESYFYCSNCKTKIPDTYEISLCLEKLVILCFKCAYLCCFKGTKYYRKVGKYEVTLPHLDFVKREVRNFIKRAYEEGGNFSSRVNQNVICSSCNQMHNDKLNDPTMIIQNSLPVYFRNMCCACLMQNMRML